MAPKKKAAKATAGPVAEVSSHQNRPATETTEPPKDEAQPASGDLKSDVAAATKDNASAGALNGAPDANEKKVEVEDESKPAGGATTSKKRKKLAEPDQSSKNGSRQSARSATKLQPAEEQLLRYLLTQDAEKLLRSEDEQRDLDTRSNIRTYSSSVLNPFEELMCAMILARPISHRLGLRSIRTVLNSPYRFTSAKAVASAGEAKRLKAMEDARTQHKGKTADQLGRLADSVLEKYATDDDNDGTQLAKALADNDDDVDQALKSLRDSIKGLAGTGLDIFLRRVQWLPAWSKGYPFADGRSRDGLRKLGLTQDAEELEQAIEKYWSKLDAKHLAGDDEATKKRRALVVVLERCTGADLENKIYEVQAAAAGA